MNGLFKKGFPKTPNKILQGWPRSPRAKGSSAYLQTQRRAALPPVSSCTCLTLNLRVPDKLLPSILGQETPGWKPRDNAGVCVHLGKLSRALLPRRLTAAEAGKAGCEQHEWAEVTALKVFPCHFSDVGVKLPGTMTWASAGLNVAAVGCETWHYCCPDPPWDHLGLLTPPNPGTPRDFNTQGPSVSWGLPLTRQALGTLSIDPVNSGGRRWRMSWAKCLLFSAQSHKRRKIKRGGRWALAS